MSYNASYDTAKARRYRFLLDELMSLCNTIPDIRSSRGRPVKFPLPTLAILLGFKFDSGMGYRDFVAFVNFNPYLLEQLGLSRAPNYSLLQKAVARIDTQFFHRMAQLIVSKKPPPRYLAVDSSGFSHTTGGEWMSIRFQKTLKRRFTALHNVVDTDTLMINATRVKARPGGDAKHMVALVKQVPSRNLKGVYGDKGYISRKNVQYISDLGAYAGIEPKSNAKVRAHGYPAYKKLVKEYQASSEKWKEKYQYGRRNLVETVFSMMKLRYGGSLSSKGYKEQRRELLFKVVLHNIERLNYLECAGR